MGGMMEPIVVTIVITCPNQIGSYPRWATRGWKSGRGTGGGGGGGGGTPPPAGRGTRVTVRTREKTPAPATIMKTRHEIRSVSVIASRNFGHVSFRRTRQMTRARKQETAAASVAVATPGA